MAMPLVKPRKVAVGRLAAPVKFHLGILCVGGIMLAVNRSLLYPLMDVVAEDMGLSAVQAGSIASVYFLFLLITQFSLSLFGPRFGLKQMLVIAFFVAGGAVLGFGLLTANYESMLFFMGIQGLTLGVYWPASYTLSVTAVPEDRRGWAAAIVGAGFAAGHAVGPAIAGVLYDLTDSWRLPFAMASVPTVLVAFGFWWLVRDAPVEVSRGRPAALFFALRNRSLLGLFLAGFCSLYGYWIVSIWGPVFFQTERGISLGSSGLYLALVTTVAVPAGLIIGSFSDRMGRRWLSWGMFLLSACALAAIAFSQSNWLLIAALVLFGLGSKFAWDPINVAWLADLIRHEQGLSLAQVVSLSSIFAMLSSVVGPPTNGWIRDRTGSLQGALLLGVALALVGAFICLRVREASGHQQA